MKRGHLFFLIVLTLIIVIPLTHAQTSPIPLSCIAISHLELQGSSNDREICTDNIDNDKDGRVDCADSDCQGNPECNLCARNCRELGLQKLNEKYAHFVDNGNNLQADTTHIQGFCIPNGDAFLGELSDRGFTFRNALSEPQKKFFTEVSEALYDDERYGYFEFFFLDVLHVLPPIAHYRYNDDKVWFSIRELDNNQADDYCDAEQDKDFDCICSTPILCPDRDGDTVPSEMAIGWICENIIADNEGVAVYDCNDNTPEVNPLIIEQFTVGKEYCGDGLDNDCDTLIDCEESGCLAGPDCLCQTEQITIPGTNEQLDVTAFDIINYEATKLISEPGIGQNGARSINSVERFLIIKDGKTSPDEVAQRMRVSVQYIGTYVDDNSFVPEGSRPLRIVMREVLKGFVTESDLSDITNHIKADFKEGNDLTMLAYKDTLYVTVGDKTKSYKTGTAASSSLSVKTINEFFAQKPSDTVKNELITMERLSESGKPQSPSFKLIQANAGGKSYTNPQDIETELFNKIILPFYDNTDEKLAESVQKFNTECK